MVAWNKANTGEGKSERKIKKGIKVTVNSWQGEVGLIEYNSCRKRRESWSDKLDHWKLNKEEWLMWCSKIHQKSVNQ